MSTDKRFSDVDGYDDTMKVTVWDKGLRGKVSFSAQGDDGETFVTVDMREFKAWLDQAYAETFGPPQREDVAHVLMATREDDSWGIPAPIAVYTNARDALKARNERNLTGQTSWVSTAPVNPNVSDRKDLA